MENTTGPIKPFLAGRLPKDKYSDANEFAADLAAILAIEQERIVIDLINLPDIKGEKGDKGDKGNPGSKGETGDSGVSLTYEGAWVTATEYPTYAVVEHNGVLYVSTSVHTSASVTEPGIGADWGDVWDVVLQLPADIVATSITLDGGTPLSDYIESTWTPVVTAASGTAPTFTTATGVFTRIGRMVFCQVILINSTGGTAGSGAGQLSISLPVNMSASQLKMRTPCGQGLDGTDELYVLTEKEASASTLKLYKGDVSGSNINISALTGGDLNDTNIRELRFEFNYLA
jgi:hypothetical protein